MIIRQLNEKEREFARVACLATVHGSCYPFALAVHDGTDMELCGVMFDGSIHHAGVRDASGRFFDGRGFVEPECVMGYEFPEVTGEYEIVTIQRHDLYDPALSDVERQIFEMSIETVRRFAQAAYPDLPWKSDTFAGRVAAFAQELEELCRKHNFYIFPQDGSPPLLVGSSEDDEWEYELKWQYEFKPTETGSHFLLSRVIDS